VRNENGHLEVSLYVPSEITPRTLAEEMLKLKVAFPKRGDVFYNLLSERIMANGFTDDRLKDAVARVLDTFNYKEINISDIVSFDKRVRLYTYNEMSEDILSQKANAAEFEARIVNDRRYWVKRRDLDQL